MTGAETRCVRMPVSRAQVSTFAERRPFELDPASAACFFRRQIGTQGRTQGLQRGDFLYSIHHLPSDTPYFVREH